jgi:hypothetical protein
MKPSIPRSSTTARQGALRDPRAQGPRAGPCARSTEPRPARASCRR